MNIFAWFRKIYEHTLKLADHPKAVWWLAVISFLESSFFPIPPDIILLPMCLANRRRALFYGLVCTVASVLGGVAGYAIGFFAMDTVGEAIISFYGAMDKYDQIKIWYEQQGAFVVFVAGLTPIPYKVITVSAGVFQLNLVVFILFSFLSRGLRFFLESAIIMWFGEPAKAFIDKHFEKLTIVGAIVFIGGFVLLKYVI